MTADLDYTCVVGIARGGIPLARGIGEVQRSRGREFTVAIWPADGRCTRLIEGDAGRSDRVLLVDDVVNSGRTARKAIGALEAGGARVAGVACLIRYPGTTPLLLGTWSGHVATVFTIQDLSLWRFGVRRAPDSDRQMQQ